MKCPIDDQTLVISERTGIEIDYCPDCRGVWLDRGELDKILDRSRGQSPAPQAAATPPVWGSPDNDRSRDRDRDRGGYDNGYNREHGQQNRRRKGSWLSELFDD